MTKHTVFSPIIRLRLASLLFIFIACMHPLKAASSTDFPSVNSKLITVPAEYKGVKTYYSLGGVQSLMDAWVYGDVALYAPEGQVDHDTAQQWISSFVLADNLYRQMSTFDDFEAQYRKPNSHFGRKKGLSSMFRGQQLHDYEANSHVPKSKEIR